MWATPALVLHESMRLPVRWRCKRSPVSLIDQLLPQRAQEMRLSGAGGAQGQHIFLAFHKAPFQQGAQLVIDGNRVRSMVSSVLDRGNREARNAR